MAQEKDVTVNVDADTDVDINTQINVIVQRARDLLEAVLKLLKKRKKRAVRLAVYEDGNKHEEVIGMGKPLSNTDTRRLFIVPKDDKDKKEKVQDGTMVATSADETVATIALDPADQLQAIITPVDDAKGMATFSFKADADLGEGTVEVTGEYSCEIIDQMASILTVEEGEDTPKGATPTPTGKK